ncbi:MAG: ThiF family adenylyltransferase [Cyclobacteriaceae bacterium]
MRIAKSLTQEIEKDLKRTHDFAWERVGFSYSKSVQLENGDWIVTIFDYQPVKDEDYVPDESCGAHINADAIQVSLQRAYSDHIGSFHTHMHELSNSPGFSGTDIESLPEVAMAAQRYSKNEVHGLLLLGEKGLNALVILPGSKELIEPELVVSVGSPLSLNYISKPLTPGKTDRYDRQSFLGKYTEDLFKRVKVAVVGLGGGGSHVVQQLAHIGFQNYILYDSDIVSDSNLNRLVGAKNKDVENKTLKFEVSKRVILGLQPIAKIEGKPCLWQEDIDTIKGADIVVGCVDGLATRRDLESECRRYLIPYIDIGMDVYTGYDPPKMFGQVQLSMPGNPCMNCTGYLSDEDLAEEADKYGVGGGRPQVVWPNAILASTAIGILIDLITGWSGDNRPLKYLDYLGNSGLIEESIHMRHSQLRTCRHYPISNCGPIKW